MTKIEEAHLQRKELAESIVFDQTLKTQLTERVIYENEMLKENFKDELTNHNKSNPISAQLFQMNTKRKLLKLLIHFLQS
jgi:hypothetical protein